MLYTYDSAGRVATKIEGSNGSSGEKLMTSYDYDSGGRRWRTVEHRDGSTNTTSPSIANGDLVTETRFTKSGQTYQTVTPGPDDPSFDWSSGDSAKTITTYAYDTGGRRYRVTDPEGNQTDTTFDLDGRAKTVTSPEGRVTSYTYDAAGQKTGVTTPSGLTSPSVVIATTSYTSTGQIHTQADPHDPGASGTDPSTRTFTYTDGGRLHTVTDANNHTVTYGYDDRGNRHSRTAKDDSNSDVVEYWVWDLNDNLSTHTMPPPSSGASSMTTTYAYDYNDSDPNNDYGNLATITDPTGRVETRSYYGSGDVKSRVFTKSGLDTQSTTLWRTRRGFVTKMRDTTGSTNRDATYTLDRAGQLTEATTPQGSIDYQWDLQHNQSQVTNPDGSIFEYTHLRTGQLYDVNAWSTSASMFVPVAAYDYNDDGAETNETIYTGSGNTREWDRNSAGQVDSYLEAMDTGSGYENYQADLTYQPDGRLASEQVNSGTTAEMTYDPAGQLTDQTGDTHYQYTYGTRGNRLSQTVGSTETDYTTNPNGSVATATTGDTVVTYSYDDAGRRTDATTVADTTTTQTDTTAYDAAGKPATESLDGTLTEDLTYHYDGNNHRWGVDLDTASENLAFRWAWDTTRAVPAPLTTNVNGAYTLHNIIGNRALAYEITGAFIAWYKLDARDSTIAPDANPTAAQGVPTSYDPYGTPTGYNQPGSMYRSEPYFTTYNLINRDYDPSVGQFTTQDPLDGLDGTPTLANPYHYVNNDPYNGIDPLGTTRLADGGLGPGPWSRGCNPYEVLLLPETIGLRMLRRMGPPCGFVDAYYTPRPVKPDWSISTINIALDTDGCSGATSGSARHAFEPACGSHDYGYDLLRYFAYVNPLDDLVALPSAMAALFLARLAADSTLYKLMNETCQGTGIIGIWNQARCYVEAGIMYAALVEWTSIERIPKR